MARSNELRIDKFFKDLEREVVSTAGVVAKSYAKDASVAIAEEWAEILARNIELGWIYPDLSPVTKHYREMRGNPSEPPWLETGELVSHIEFRWTSQPSKNYDLLEVGVWDNSTKIGHNDDKTPLQLALINEYGLHESYTDSKGNAREVNIPARPHFRNSATQIGYEFDRVLTDVDRKIQIALDREKRSILKNELQNRSNLYRYSSTAPSRYGGSGSDVTTIGRFRVDGRRITFGWDTGVTDSS